MKDESKLLVKEKELVVPGDTIAKGLEYLPGAGCYRTDHEINSKMLGLLKVKDRMLSVIPLSGVYMPKPGDGVIGIIADMHSTFWIVDINSPYYSILQIGEAVKEYVDLSKTDISVYFDVGDVVYAKILNVTKAKNIQLSMADYRAKKLAGGRLLKITPSKVPRLIGKGGSMIELIKSKTGCQIVVGQNGLVWLRGTNESLASRAVEMVEEMAHTRGLTDRITKMLEESG